MSDIEPFVELGARAALGVPLLLIGIWSISYIERPGNRGVGPWPFILAMVSIPAGVVLLLYRGSLLP